MIGISLKEVALWEVIFTSVFISPDIGAIEYISWFVLTLKLGFHLAVTSANERQLALTKWAVTFL